MSTVSNVTLFAMTLCALTLAGCGGSSPRGGVELMPQAPAPVEHTVMLSVGLAGQVSSGGAWEDHGAFIVGDVSDLFDVRTVMEFPLQDLPTGAQIVSARLVVHQLSVVGEPYELGNLFVEHVYLGLELNRNDHDSISLRQVGVISRNPSPGERTLDASGAVRTSLERRWKEVGFRLRFPIVTDRDGVGDYVLLHSPSDDDTSTHPRLIVTYTIAS